jgi:molybdenum cofactor synthesis domain-containing protein
VRAAVITVSTSRSAPGAEADDESGPALAEFARSLGLDVAGTEIVGDDRESIESRLRHWADTEDCDLVLTSGGTGFAPTDVTPEATLAAIDREAPGLAEAMRDASREHTPNWMLSRGVAGIRGSTLIINFPGSPRSIAQAGDAISSALPHALELLAGSRSTHSG